MEEYCKTANYKYTNFQPSVGNMGINKSFTPIDVKDWPPENLPYSSLDGVDMWFEMLDRAFEFISLGSVSTRYAGNGGIKNATAIDEISSYDANNLYERIKGSPSVKNVFKDLGTGVSGKTTDNGYDAIVSILAEADPDRYMIYSFFGTVTPDMGKPSRLLIEPQPYTIKGQDFSATSKTITYDKVDGFLI